MVKWPAKMSSTYERFVQSMIEGKQIVCTYNGFSRMVCVILLGLDKKYDEAALVYQVDGGSSGKVPDWRSMKLAGVTDVELRDGPLVSGDRHSGRQSIVRYVDLDINPNSPYNPRRSLEKLRREAKRKGPPKRPPRKRS
jgi:hypothetical protein